MEALSGQMENWGLRGVEIGLLIGVKYQPGQSNDYLHAWVEGLETRCAAAVATCISDEDECSSARLRAT